MLVTSMGKDVLESNTYWKRCFAIRLYAAAQGGECSICDIAPDVILITARGKRMLICLGL